jgi:carboxymethylenebutenolidase
MEREIRIATPSGSMRTFIAHPDGDGPYPVGLIYMDAPGYRDALRDIARRYAAAGYLAVAPDMYHAMGDDITIDIAKIGEQGGMGGEEGQRLMGFVRSLTPEVGATYTQAILGQLADEPAAAGGPKLCLGFCMGARHVVHTLATFPGDFAAGVGIHPGPLATEAPDSPHHQLADVRGELYLGLAETDEASAPAVLAALREAADASGMTLTMEVYEGTYHGFAMSDIPVFDEAAYERHVAATIDTWGRHAEPAPVG